MTHLEHGVILMSVAMLLLGTVAVRAAAPEDLPEAEKALADTVDPWGLAFSDQLARFRSYFAEHPDAPFALGLTHDLVKVWPNKYWFRGETFCPGGTETPVATQELWAAAGETVSFQVAVLPRLGTPEATYRIGVEVAFAAPPSGGHEALTSPLRTQEGTGGRYAKHDAPAPDSWGWQALCHLVGHPHAPLFAAHCPIAGPFLLRRAERQHHVDVQEHLFW